MSSRNIEMLNVLTLRYETSREGSGIVHGKVKDEDTQAD